MPYSKWSEINNALKGIKPKISLAQANLIADWADAMERAEDGPESPWAAAIAQFKKLYRVQGGKWVKRKQKESGMEYKAYTMSTNNVLISVNAIDVDGQAVPVAELVAAYQEQRGKGQGVGGPRQGDGGADVCVCPECGHEVEHEKGTPCNEMECPECGAEMVGENEAFAEAVWTTAFVNDLPDSSFAVIMPGGEKDEEDKTKPRSLRKLPYKDAGGKVDIPHLRNALARLPQMKGVSAKLKAKALKTLQAAAKKHLKTHQEEMDKELLEAVSGSLEDYAGRVKDAFRNAFGRRGEAGFVDSPWASAVFVNDPDLGTSVVVSDDGKMYSVEYEEGEDGFTFADRGRWHEVVLTYKKTEATTAQEVAELHENATFDAFMPEGDHTVAIMEVVKEAGVTVGEGRRAPVVVDLQIIRPGPGNKKDKRYYPPETLKKYGRVFKNADVFVTDHKEKERSERTKVGRVRECPVRFTREGALVGRTVVYDPDMAEKIRNRADSSELHTLHCSIYGTGDVQPGKVGGEEYGIVKSINANPLVEFVSKAGAGGKALSLAESNTGGVKMDKEQIEKLLSESDLPQDVQERLAGVEYKDEEAVKEAILKEQAQQQEAPQKLAEADVEKAVGATKLPEFARAALKAREYADEAELKEAIAEAVKEVAKLTGSGQPFGQGGSESAQDKPLSEREKIIQFNEIMDAVGGRQVPVPAEQ